jgi:hypothetical protein
MGRAEKRKHKLRVMTPEDGIMGNMYFGAGHKVYRCTCGDQIATGRTKDRALAEHIKAKGAN